MFSAKCKVQSTEYKVQSGKGKGERDEQGRPSPRPRPRKGTVYQDQDYD